VVTPRFPESLDGRASSDLRISPDGRYAVYVSVGRNSLELVNVSTGEQRTLVRSALTATTPVWRPDSRSVRYTRDGTVPGPNATRGVHEVTIDGVDKLIRALPFTEFPGPATVPINDTLVSAFGPPAQDHRILALNGTASRVVHPVSVQGAGQLSPDGRTIAISAGSLAESPPKPIRQVVLESLADGSARTLDLPFTRARFTAMQWHPDGKGLFIAGRNSPSEPMTFYLVPIDGSAPRVMARTETWEPNSTFAVSPDTRYIAFVAGSKSRSTLLSLDFTESVSRLSTKSREN